MRGGSMKSWLAGSHLELGLKAVPRSRQQLIGQMQCKFLRLGKSLYLEATTDTAARLVESLSSLWASGRRARVDLCGIFDHRVWARSLEVSRRLLPIDATTFNWVLKLFLDVGVPPQSMLAAIITIWKKHAISPRAGKDQLRVRGLLPNLVDLCDGYHGSTRHITEWKRRHRRYGLFRRVKSELLNFRTLVAGNSNLKTRHDKTKHPRCVT
ncbi:hypothetical protein GN958_ATG23379 [Phytophthora infestans]|uniref:Uncharacterized protein n=1 Tax=Phytophthora infestans TaxID=4787 RepID=A0A8S9TL23_PHYIN|nr:hypothetical protein GN958_ATG23379 [Phytophthora infestans]